MIPEAVALEQACIRTFLLLRNSPRMAHLMLAGATMHMRGAASTQVASDKLNSALIAHLDPFQLWIND